MKYRPHRGSLMESIKYTVVIEPTFDALKTIILQDHPELTINESDISFSFVGEDQRMDHDWMTTYVVCYQGKGIGFSNACI